MSHIPPQQALRGLPIGETFSKAYRSLFDNLRHFPKALFFPILLSIGLSIAFSGFIFTNDSLPDTGGAELGFSLEFLALQLLSAVPYALFTTAWHRLVLFGADQEPPSLMPHWHRRHTRMLLTLLAVNIAWALPVFGILAIWYPAAEPYFNAVLAGTTPDQIDPQVAAGALPLLGAMSVWGFLALFLFLRISFVFPAIAADESYGVGDAWRHTRGQGFRLIVVFFAISLPVFFVSALLVGLPFVSLVINYLLIALWTGLFSTAFRHSTGWIPDAPTAPVPWDGDRDDG
ncbi:MAG: hypothetical protein AAF530_11635 [Pseudomonadota bacterium]